MNRRFFMVCFLFLTLISTAWANPGQYPDPQRQTFWNDLTDGMHTLGQDPRHKNATLKRLHNARTAARIRSINKDKLAKFHAKRKCLSNIR